VSGARWWEEGGGDRASASPVSVEPQPLKGRWWKVGNLCKESWRVFCNVDNDSSRQKEIRSHGNVDLEKDGES